MKQIASPEPLVCPQCGYRALPELAGPPYTQASSIGRVVLSDDTGKSRCPKCQGFMMSQK